MSLHTFHTRGGVTPLDPTAARVLGPPTRVIPSRPGDELTTPPLGDSRGFVHKRNIGGIGGFLTGGPGGAIAGFLRGGKKAPAQTVPQRALCPPGMFETPAGGCQAAVAAPVALPLQIIQPPVHVGGGAGPDPRMDLLTTGTAAAANGARGPGRPGGFAPDVREQFYRDCGPGAVLAKDGLCYNRRDLRNNERKWPRGRRPLLTGGEMRAISTASSAAKKLQRKQKQLQSMGMLPKPQRRAAKAEPKLLAAGHHAHVAHD